MIQYILSFLGFALVLNQFRKLYFRLLPFFTTPTDIQKLYGNEKKDAWALITGSSEGIGKEWAIQLSQKGFNIILISRSYDKLESVSKCLNPLVKFKIITQDFTKSNEDNFFENLLKQLSDFEISIIVNNVGVIDIQEYTDIPENLIRSHITVIKQKKYDIIKKKRKAQIISMSSYAQEYPNPYYNIYSSSKAFIQYLFTSLKHSKHNNHVQFTTFRPFYIKTAMVNYKSLPFTITPQFFIKSCINVLGKTSDSNGTLIHEIFSYISSLLPDFIKDIIFPLVSKQAMYQLEFKKR
ncbi:short chain dehydrogenase reductase family protein, putative [Ichthyophthirius multifiliis]|uniref:Short chain dehydrogenase reductase family protein, putative n=1 Tax=Ichthyophthirius multifiliis TaxID=5932 RepID=G0QWZ9_ICHMU|nr:short chain dehydrogenase reductase family protein, putative [Ichthyophthirius multifiliis]EGR30263.1 short chain dehydrogenase reductase family protein, putative [Ichthyophthirius multifiliis]|eukprot:XP_004031859.1 short chain dehydrogenase reductase family protein, putative [Ichthyophthirius multifiliis]